MLRNFGVVGIKSYFDVECLIQLFSATVTLLLLLFTDDRVTETVTV